MFWKKCNVIEFKIDNKEFVRLSNSDVKTNTPYWVYLSKSMYSNLKEGKEFNNVLAMCDFGTKLFLATGQAPMTHEVFEFKRAVRRKVFITNAVAHSVAYYAWVYINHHYKVSNSTWYNKDVDYIEKKFLKQSEDFLLLYKDIVKNIDEILPRFTENELIHFFKDINISNIRQKFIRKVYHTHLECNHMRSDYEDENTFHLNTGVFYENELLNGTHVYCLDEMYLRELGMRECKICQKLT